MNTEPHEHRLITESLTEEDIVRTGKKHTELAKKMRNAQHYAIIPKCGKSGPISSRWWTIYCNFDKIIHIISEMWRRQFYTNNHCSKLTIKDGNNIERDIAELFTGRDQTESTLDYNPKEHLLTDEELHALSDIPFIITNKKKIYRPLPKVLTEEEREYINDLFTEIRSYFESKELKIFISHTNVNETIQRMLTQMDDFMTLI